MKLLGYFFIFIILINFSCSKTIDGVHFHGRITLDCNNQIPVNNCMVKIHRQYDTGVGQIQDIGTTFTDNEGYYSFTTDVKQKGVFSGYAVSFITGDDAKTSSFPMFHNGAAVSTDNDIELNINAKGYHGYKFHIKNVSSVNSGDVFNSLIVYNQNADYTNITNFMGANVDTIIYQFYFNESKINYKYSYTKNGVLTSVPPDTLSDPNCEDTVNVNIFY